MHYLEAEREVLHVFNACWRLSLTASKNCRLLGELWSAARCQSREKKSASAEIEKIGVHSQKKDALAQVAACINLNVLYAFSHTQSARVMHHEVRSDVM